jgi:hypothetical protein
LDGVPPKPLFRLFRYYQVPTAQIWKSACVLIRRNLSSFRSQGETFGQLDDKAGRFPISEVKNMRVTKQLFVVSFCMWSWLWLWEGPAYTQTGNAQRRGQGGSSANQASQLLTNLQAVYQTGAVTPAQQQAILNSLAAIFPRGNRPATTTLTALANDLTVAVAAGKMTPSQAVKLSQDVAQVFRAGMSNLQAALQLVRADVQAMPTTTRLTLADIQTLSNDINALIMPLVQNAGQ